MLPDFVAFWMKPKISAQEGESGFWFPQIETIFINKSHHVCLMLSKSATERSNLQFQLQPISLATSWVFLFLNVGTPPLATTIPPPGAQQRCLTWPLSTWGLTLVMKWGLGLPFHVWFWRAPSNNWCTTYTTGSTHVPCPKWHSHPIKSAVTHTRKERTRTIIMAPSAPFSSRSRCPL